MLQPRGYLLCEDIDELLFHKQQFFEAFVQYFDGCIVFDSLFLLVEQEILQDDLEYEGEVILIGGKADGVEQQFESAEEQVVVLVLGVVLVGSSEHVHDELADGCHVVVLLEEGVLFPDEGVHVVDEEHEDQFTVFLVGDGLYFQ